MAGASLSSRRSRLLGLGGFLGHGAGEVDAMGQQLVVRGQDMGLEGTKPPYKTASARIRTSNVYYDLCMLWFDVWRSILLAHSNFGG
jgi:hypothetical protein